MESIYNYLLTCNLDEFKSLLGYCKLDFQVLSEKNILDEFFDAKFDFKNWLNKFSDKEKSLMSDFVSK